MRDLVDKILIMLTQRNEQSYSDLHPRIRCQGLRQHIHTSTQTQIPQDNAKHPCGLYKCLSCPGIEFATASHQSVAMIIATTRR